MELQRRAADFEANGIAVLAISPDPVEALAAFAEEHHITYPLLSDAGSVVIRRYGILNTLIEPGEQYYGLPFPGSYLVGADGRVAQKFFHRRYQDRETADVVLHSGFAVPIDLSANPSGTDDAEVRVVLAAPSLRYGQVAELYVYIDLPPGQHVYGTPVPEGFIPTAVTVTGPASVRIDEPRVPPTRPFHIAGIADTFHVLDDHVEIAIPIVSTEREATEIALDVRVRYQACTDRECFVPRDRQITLHIPIEPLYTRRPGA